LRRIRYALALILVGSLIGAAGMWRFGNAMTSFYARALDKLGRVVAQWSPPPAPQSTWEASPGLVLEPHAKGLDYPARVAAPPPAIARESGIAYYVGELPGRIRAIDAEGNAQVVASDLLNFDWFEIAELGLMGLDVAPDGSRLYVTRTYWDEEGGVYRNRVDALELAPDRKSVVAQVPLLDMRSESTIASYCVQFVEVGPDGLVYVGVGKGADARDAQRLDRFAGKILRMTPDGRAASENPFYDADAPDAVASYIYALGFRNPFDLTFHPSDPDVAIVSDVGPGVDRILRLEAGRNYCFGAGSGDEAMRCNALYTWGPGGGYAPTGVALTDRPPLGAARGTPGTLYVGIFGSVHMPGPNAGKRITRFPVQAGGYLLQGPETIARYGGLFYSSVTDVEIIDGDLYFADIFGAGERPHRDRGIVYRLVSSPDGTDATVPAADDPSLSPYQRGEALFAANGCAGCHGRTPEDGEREGPVLDSDLAARLEERLGGADYRARLETLAARPGTYFVERRDLYQRLGTLAGRELVRSWFKEHVRDPRFDAPDSKMPSFPELTDAQLESLASYLLGR